MSDARRYTVWPDPRSMSRSRALQSWKSFHFQKLSPPFTMGAGNWPRVLNYGTISKFVWVRFFIFVLVFVSRDFEVGTNVSCEESTVSLRTGLIFFCMVSPKKRCSLDHQTWDRNVARWFPETHLFWGKKVTRHKDVVGVGRGTLVSAGFF